MTLRFEIWRAESLAADRTARATTQWRCWCTPTRTSCCREARRFKTKHKKKTSA